ncbi:DUF1129 family protein [Apilactobacillus timberlakei]|uniref:DUF1129 domain-containing protein n=1 Tax=Apilactobacillus timberlakei TaxID=2008380 RepID=A0ABY2YSG0_9LACO|nr:DUF1129 family protein [Apilactobacillus timberlakei]TPR13051.1 DUF1129 domain-containing protein [Apilactobacillus timberlakei]TPR14102.1 DUF1129 domain-containing protein [Apilactobacillus timberlakei]TPR16356.1 DUF1129 domain-containing protein [Apilactobacillus timberlakei]TPR17993.1 DUF1129 domain-containing protein [Apilactobacillus timberlakei]TPR19795.1 DUF1129 domain-containing protein [Apilactobacillus timberlakei]
MTEEKRNAHVQQKHHDKDKEERSQFDNIGLTKRNADYMFRFNRALRGTDLSVDRKSEIISQMKDQLLVEQKHGATARNLYGTVEERIDFIMNPPKKPTKLMDNFWPNAVYNMLFFGIIFNILYGITLLISKGGQVEQSAGIVSIIVLSMLSGIIMPLLTRMLDSNVQHTYSGWMRALFMLLIIIAWVLSFTLSMSIPRAINPVVPFYVNFVIAAVAIGFAIYVYRKYTITVNFFTPNANRRR